MPAPQIADDEKYAIIALPRLPLDLVNLPEETELVHGLGYAQKLPFSLAQHWQEWIGTVRAEQLAKAQLILIATTPSNSPGVLDGENEHLKGLVSRLYQGLQLVCPIWIEGDVVLLTGAHNRGQVDVRQISSITRPSTIHYGKIGLIGSGALKIAAELVPILNDFPKGKYLRLCRVLNAYFSGIADNDLRERLHQFCRCIEGLILAEPGQTTRQFKSRTELFVGPKLHEFMGNLYENRSAVEHMNDPVLSPQTEIEQRKAFMEMVLVSEEIARYCLLNVLLKQNVRLQYQDEASLAAFWSRKSIDRQSAWGPPLDVVALRKDLQQH